MSRGPKTPEQRANRNVRRRVYEAEKKAPDPGCRKHRQREALRRWALAKYGLTIQAYEFILSQQAGRCKICFILPTKRALSVDHCHSTGRVRGLLCHNCNLAIGLLKDDAGNVRRMLEYLSVVVD